MPQADIPAIAGVVLLVPEARAITPYAHVTLLAPFTSDPTAGELADLEKYFADETPFDFKLTELCTFPDGTRYLAPDPAGRFSRMTHALHQLFPEYPPYEGRYDLVVPHLSVPEEAVIGPLPLAGHARKATLLHHEDGLFTELATFPFGTTAA